MAMAMAMSLPWQDCLRCGCGGGICGDGRGRLLRLQWREIASNVAALLRLSSEQLRLEKIASNVLRCLPGE